MVHREYGSPKQREAREARRALPTDRPRRRSNVESIGATSTYQHDRVLRRQISDMPCEGFPDRNSAKPLTSERCADA